MKKQTNISKSFITFLIVSTLIWLLINLSKEYTSTLKYEVSYEKLAQDKILQEEPISTVNLSVKATGFKLISTNFSNKKLKLFAHKLSKKTSNNYYFLPQNQRVRIQNQLPSRVRLQKILVDTIFLKLGSLATKKVPVKANVDIQYKIGYNIAKSVKITPDSIQISGPEMQLKNVTNVALEPLKLEDVSLNIEKELTILTPKNAGKVKLSAKKATVFVEVDKFTEGELEVPVLVKNISANTKLNVYPKNVKIIYKVGLKDFNKVASGAFKVICDYKHSKKEGFSYLIPKLQTKPDFVSSVRIVPEKIDFLIHK